MSAPKLKLTVDIMHGTRLRVSAPDLIRPGGHGSQVTFRLGRQDLAERLFGRGMKVDLGDGGYDLVACRRRKEDKGRG
jgi:hypothetical protein